MSEKEIADERKDIVIKPYDSAHEKLDVILAELAEVKDRLRYQDQRTSLILEYLEQVNDLTEELHEWHQPDDTGRQGWQGDDLLEELLLVKQLLQDTQAR